MSIVYAQASEIATPNLILYNIVAINRAGDCGRKRYSSGTTALTAESKNTSSAAPTATVSDVSIRDFSEDSNTPKEKFSMEVPIKETDIIAYASPANTKNSYAPSASQKADTAASTYKIADIFI